MMSTNLQKYKSDIEDAKLSIEVIQKNYKGIFNDMKEHTDYLKSSFYKNGLHKYFGVHKQGLNLAPYQYLFNTAYKSIFKHLKDLNVGAIRTEKYLSAYSAVEYFVQNYRDLQMFYDHKFAEHNSISSKYETRMLEVVQKLNLILYSDASLTLKSQFAASPLSDRALFRKQNPTYEIYDKLDNMTNDYNLSNKSFLETWGTRSAYVSVDRTYRNV